MSLRDIAIKNSYDSNIDDVVNDFYIPTLSNSIRYDRIAGFFTSSSLAISCRGILQLIENNKTSIKSRIRILASPKLNDIDVRTIDSALSNPDKYINDILYKELISSEIDIVDNYRALLAHLIAKGIAEIKLIYIKKEGKLQTADEIEKSAMFHQKVGVLYDDEDNKISFSGSINESFNAWNNNIEEFKTFKSWAPGISEYCQSDIDKFEDYWNMRRDNVYVTPLPDAIRDKYIEIAHTTDFDDLRSKLAARKHRYDFQNIVSNLFSFQKEAMQQWEAGKRQMLFAMATGTGKTRTAIACMASILDKYKLLVIIATPQTSLNKQWESEIEKLDISFDRKIICDSTNPRYKTDIAKYTSWLKSGALNNLALFVTHTTAASEYFRDMVSSVKQSNCKILFIGDEVHGMGSPEHKLALQECYDYRIGLSATPERWFDDEGSEIIKDYFGHDVYEFGIDKAITTINPITGKTFLSQYKYFIRPTYLTSEEDEKYADYTQKASRVTGNDEEAVERRNFLYMRRAAILKSATNKLDTFRDIVHEIQNSHSIKNTIVFCADSAQVNEVLTILRTNGIIASPFTQKQGQKASADYNGKSERESIISQFKDEMIEVLVAIKCMDEGLDIPSADTAIILSSTTNPREYIQRIGRVIRHYPGKRYANIYDVVVKSTDERNRLSIQKNETARLLDIVELASNGSEAITEIYK